MKHRPRLLDLFCGAGGAAMGYYRAGFNVIGVDHKLQKRYPFEFVHADALEYMAEHGHEFDAIHASPPCQHYSVTVAFRPENNIRYPDLIGLLREKLYETSRPFVIENVVGAPLNGVIMLCGTMFGLRTYRHRWFESNVLLFQPTHLSHPEVIGSNLAKYQVDPTKFATITGHTFTVEVGQCALGIDWITKRDDLAEAIPPAYTEFIGKQLMAAL